MGITIAKNISFCFGVKNAIDNALSFTKTTDKNVYSIGELIHNTNVNKMIYDSGIKTIDESEIEALIDKNSFFIIRAHGIKKVLLKKLESYKEKKLIDFYDATCPFVKNIHAYLEKNTSNNTLTLYLGGKNHPETIGSLSYINGEYVVVENYEEYLDVYKSLIASHKDIIFFSQTTSSVEVFKNIEQHLKKSIPNCKIFNSICYTTISRQEEVDSISKKVDYCFVVGDKKSSNTLKLLHISNNNCINTLFVQNINDVTYLPNPNKYDIGIVSGASSPLCDIDNLVDLLKKSFN